MTVENIINGAVSVQKTIIGIQSTFVDAPSSLNQLPAFVTYPTDGEIEWPRKPNVRTTTHTIDMDLYVQKGGDLSATDRLLKPYVSKVINAFDQNLTLGGNAFNSGVVNYKYGTLNYAGSDYLGIKFTLKAIEKEQVIYKP